MMKKKIILGLLCTVGAALIATSSLAASGLTSRMTSSGNAIGVFTITTPGNVPIKIDEVTIFAGKSCNSMFNVLNIRASNMFVAPGQYPLTSEDLIEVAGPAMGCVKETNVYVNADSVETVIESGPIALTWDSGTQRYTAASPSSITINY